MIIWAISYFSSTLFNKAVKQRLRLDKAQDCNLGSLIYQHIIRTRLWQQVNAIVAQLLSKSPLIFWMCSFVTVRSVDDLPVATESVLW